VQIGFRRLFKGMLKNLKAPLIFSSLFLFFCVCDPELALSHPCAMTNPSPKRQKVKAGPSSIKDDPVYTSAPQSTTPTTQSTTPTTTTTKTTSLRTPFLDAFWKLASDDPSVRSDAAITLIEHCFPTSSSSPSTMGDDDDDDNDSSSNDAAITKDREYALKRLMKGLCSGRGSARQGFASALQSFITASLPTNTYTSSSLHTGERSEASRSKRSEPQQAKRAAGSEASSNKRSEQQAKRAASEASSKRSEQQAKRASRN